MRNHGATELREQGSTESRIDGYAELRIGGKSLKQHIMIKKKLSYKEVMDNLKRISVDYFSSAEYEIKALKETYGKYDDSNLYPYIPMRLVALLEGYFQELYSNIIDTDVKYRNNCAEFIKDVKFEPAMINSFEQNTITFGEFASMLLPCNKLDDILNNLKILLDSDGFVGKFANTTILSDISEIFSYRHIFCHEIAGNVVLRKEQVQRMLDSALVFMETISDYVFDILYPNVSVLTTEMNEDAKKEYDNKDEELHCLISWLKANMGDDLIDDELNFLDIFDDYRKRRAKKVCQGMEGGTIYSSYYALTMAEITDELINALKKKYRFWLRRRNFSH